MPWGWISRVSIFFDRMLELFVEEDQRRRENERSTGKKKVILATPSTSLFFFSYLKPSHAEMRNYCGIHSGNISCNCLKYHHPWSPHVNWTRKRKSSLSLFPLRSFSKLASIFSFHEKVHTYTHCHEVQHQHHDDDDVDECLTDSIWT